MTQVILFVPEKVAEFVSVPISRRLNVPLVAAKFTANLAKVFAFVSAEFDVPNPDPT